MARRRTLTPLIGVRIPVPQPVNFQGLEERFFKAFFVSSVQKKMKTQRHHS